MKRLAAALGACAVLLTGCAEDGAVRDSGRNTPVTRPRPATSSGSTASPGSSSTTKVPLANPGEKDYAPRPDEVPTNIGAVPDAVPQPEDKSQYGNPSSYEVYGKRYEILSDPRGFRERGYASWYGKKFHGKRTSSGVPYDMFAMTGAHKTLPIPTYCRVTNVENGKSVIVKINDRGPFHDGRIVDLSYAAAHKLDMLGNGSTLVDLEVITPGESPAISPSPAVGTEIVSAAPARPVTIIGSPPPLQTEKPPTLVPPPAPPKAGAPRYLQAGVFGDAVNAAAFREKLASSGVKPLLMKSESRNNRWVYRVLVGPFADQRQLDSARSRLSADATPTIPVVD